MTTITTNVNHWFIRYLLVVHQPGKVPRNVPSSTIEEFRFFLPDIGTTEKGTILVTSSQLAVEPARPCKHMKTGLSFGAPCTFPRPREPVSWLLPWKEEKECCR